MIYGTVQMQYKVTKICFPYPAINVTELKRYQIDMLTPFSFSSFN